MGTLTKHAPSLGRKSKVMVALLPKGVRARPADASFLSTGDVIAGQTSISLNHATGTVVAAGQYLRFVTPTGEERLVKVSTTTPANATAIPVVALTEDLPAGSTADFPVEFFDRSAADIDFSYNLAEVSTLNTGGNRDGVITGGSADINLPGIFYHYCAGANTVFEAANNGAEVWLEIEYEAPGEGYAHGRRIGGPAGVTGRTQASPNDGFVSADIKAAFLGGVDERMPVKAQ